MARLALRWVLPSDGQHARVHFESLTLRLQLLRPAVRFDLTGLELEEAPGGQLTRKIDRLQIEFSKMALIRGNWLPARLEIFKPVLSIDLTKPTTPLASVQNHAVRNDRPSGPLASYTAALRAFMPLPENPCRLVVHEPSIIVVIPGRSNQWRFKDIDQTFSRFGDHLQFAFSLNLANALRPVSLTCRVHGSLATGLADFSIHVAPFNSADLPPLPILPGESEPSKFQVALDLVGKLRIDALRFEEITFNVLFEEGEFHLPAVKSGPIHLHRVELRGRAWNDFSNLHFDKAILALDSFHFDASGADLETGSQYRLKTHVAIVGPTGADMGAYLTPISRSSLPFPTAAMHELQIESVVVDVDGSAALEPDHQLAVRTLAFAGRVNLNLKGERIPLEIGANYDPPSSLLRAHCRLADFYPARLHWAPDQPFAALAALDVPIDFEAQVTATARGELLSAAASAHFGPGHLRPFGALRKELATGPLNVTAQTFDAGRTIRVSDMKLELGGPVLTVRDLDISLSSGGGTKVRGQVEIEQLDAQQTGAFDSAALLGSMQSFGVRAADLKITKLHADLSLQTVLGTKDGWPLTVGTLAGGADLTIQGEPLTIGLAGALNGRDDTIETSLTIDHLRLQKFRFQLAAGIGTQDLDFPVSLQLQLVCGRQTGVRLLGGHLAAGPGVIHRNGVWDRDIAVTSLSLDAAADEGGQRLEFRRFRAELDGMVVRGENLKFLFGAVPMVSGSFDIEGATVGALINFWPSSFQAATRRQIVDAVHGGRISKASFQCNGPLNSLNQTQFGNWVGELVLDGLQIVSPILPGPLACERIAVAIHSQEATVTMSGLAAPGLELTNASAHLTDLFSRVPKLEIRSAFNAEFSTVSSWLKSVGGTLPASLSLDLARLTGSATGDLHATLPLTPFQPVEVEASLRARIKGMAARFIVPHMEIDGGDLTFSVNLRHGEFSTVWDCQGAGFTAPEFRAGSASLHLDANWSQSDEMTVHVMLDPGADYRILQRIRGPTVLGPLTAEAHLSGWRTQTHTTADVTVASSEVLGYPLAISASATILNSNSAIETLNLTRLQLGKTNLTAKISRLGPRLSIVEIGGSELDAAGLASALAPFFSEPESSQSTAPSLYVAPNHPAPSQIPASVARKAPKNSQAKKSPADPPTEYYAAATGAGRLSTTLRIDRVDCGNEQIIKNLFFSADFIDTVPQAMLLRGEAPGLNTLSLEVTPAGDVRQVKLKIDDTAAWLQLVTVPVCTLNWPGNPIGDLATKLREIPILFRGGKLFLDGEFCPRTPARLFEGKCKILETVIRQAPRALQLVAFKLKKSLQENPLIKEVLIERLFLSDTLFAMEGIRSDALSLEYLKVNFVRYGIVDEALHVDGRYLGVGFEVVGTRAAPQVYLKDNSLIRALGTSDEFDFGNHPPEAPAPPPKKPKTI